MSDKIINDAFIELSSMSVDKIVDNFYLNPKNEWLRKSEEEEQKFSNTVDKEATELESDIQIDNCEVYMHEFVTNPTNTWSNHNVVYVYPLNIVGIVNTIKYCCQHNKKIKAAGSYHSYSQTLQVSPDNLMVDLDYCDDIDPENLLRTKQSFNKLQGLLQEIEDNTIPHNNYINVPAGIKIWQLNEILCPSNTQLNNIHGKRSLLNMGGGAVQSFCGAFSTGTHGSGGKFAAYHDMIKSVLLIDSNGNVKRIEPTNGFLNRDYVEIIDGISVERILDDSIFNSVIVSMGCMGVIHSLIIEVQEMKLLHEDAYYNGINWDVVKDNIRSNVQNNDHYYLQLNPYAINSNSHSVLEKKVNTTQVIPVNRKDGGRNFFPEFFANCQASIRITRGILNMGFSELVVRIIEGSLKSREDNTNNGKGGYTDLTYRVWNAGSGKLKDIGTGIEFAFPMDNVSTVVDDLLSHIKTITNRNTRYYLNAPIAIRFVKSSDAIIAPNQAQYFQDNQIKSTDYWAYIEILRVNAVSKKVDEMELQLYDNLQQFLLAKGGRPHWGLNFEINLSKPMLSKLYPGFQSWLDCYNELNGNRIFSNAFSSNLDHEIA